jgi:phosphoglycolate phosphatase
MADLALFDFDGTLVDSRFVIVDNVQKAARAAGADVPPAIRIIEGIGLPPDQAHGRLFGHLLEDVSKAVRTAFVELMEDYRRMNKGYAPLFPGAREGLKRLSDARVMSGIVTSFGIRTLEESLIEAGIRDLFVCLKTPDHGPGKPSPYLILEALRETGVSAGRAVMVGDSSYDMQAAVNAGVRPIGVSWGNHPAVVLRDYGAETVVDDFEELVTAVLD